ALGDEEPALALGADPELGIAEVDVVGDAGIAGIVDVRNGGHRSTVLFLRTSVVAVQTTRPTSGGMRPAGTRRRKPLRPEASQHRVALGRYRQDNGIGRAI